MEAKILVAGVGNIFLGDDAFGVEVVRRLACKVFPPNVSVMDFGIRGFDLAYALMQDWHTVFLVDAVARGESPGTLYRIEPDVEDLRNSVTTNFAAAAHSVDPLCALQFVYANLGRIPKVVVIGCEPTTLECTDGQMGLSELVEKSAEEAVLLIESLVMATCAGASDYTPRKKASICV
jgi:hydrogenase maturation protease